MNVAFDPWIPVVTAAGERILASLCGVLTEGEKFADLAVRPHERVSLMRLFLCVAHAALDGPKDYLEWREVPKRLPEASLTYLTHWRDSFELFHEEKPWLQVADLNYLPSENSGDQRDAKGWSPLSRLCFSRASGINTTLFDHTANGGSATEYSVEEIALNLLTFQNFFVAGGKASSRLWGDIEMKNPPNPKGGPCAGKSILFTLLRGKTVTDSIHSNLNTYEDLKLLYGGLEDWAGKPLWELPIKSPTDTRAIVNATETYVGRLVPQTRILRLNKDRKRVLFGSGFLYPKFQDENGGFPPDSFVTTVLRDDRRELLSARPGVSAWRELCSLIVCNRSASNACRGPLCLRNVPDTTDCDIITSAMITNPKKAAEIVDIVESVIHVPSHLRAPAGIKVYEKEVAKAEMMGNRLGLAIEEYRKEIDGDWVNRLDRAKQDKWALKARLRLSSTMFFWTAVERNLHLLMIHIKANGTENAIPSRDGWRKMLFVSALEAYRTVCGQETPRQVRAFAKGWKQLTAARDNETDDTKLLKEDEE